MTVQYSVEYFEDKFEELMPILEENHKESGVFPDKIDLEVEQNFYVWSNQNNNVLLIMARDDEKDNQIVGYCVTFIGAHPHYKEHLFATNDVFYVHPDYRHTDVAKTLIESTTVAAREGGASVVSFHTKMDNPCKSLMESVGFSAEEIQYFKYIKE